MKVDDFRLNNLIDIKFMHDVDKMIGKIRSYRYMALEVFELQSYDKLVDVFSFEMIVYKMFEGVVSLKIRMHTKLPHYLLETISS